MALMYKLYQNMNKKSPYYENWYGRAVSVGTVTTDQLADTIEANCTVKRADILAVLSELVVTMRNELQNSKRVKIDRLGTFKLAITTSRSATAKGFSVSENLRNIRVLFQPELKVGKDGTRVRSLVNGCQVMELPFNNVVKTAAGEQDQE